jgi:hypothetical protein
MGLYGEGLGCFLDSSTQCTYRDVGEVLGVECLKAEAIGKHVDNLGNTDASSFNGEFSACPVRTGLKIFHNMSIVAIRLEKVKYDKVNLIC